MPWKPVGDTKPTRSTDDNVNVLLPPGFNLEMIAHARPCHKLKFTNNIIDTRGNDKAEGSLEKTSSYFHGL
jgi:hypothetical protein